MDDETMQSNINELVEDIKSRKSNPGDDYFQKMKEMNEKLDKALKVIDVLLKESEKNKEIVRKFENLNGNRLRAPISMTTTSW